MPAAATFRLPCIALLCLLVGGAAGGPAHAAPLSMAPMRQVVGQRMAHEILGGQPPFRGRPLRRDLAQVQVEGHRLVVVALAVGRCPILLSDASGQACQVSLQILATPPKAGALRAPQVPPPAVPPIGMGFHAVATPAELGPGEGCTVQLHNGYPPYRARVDGAVVPVRGTRFAWTIPSRLAVKTPRPFRLEFLDVRQQRCFATVTLRPPGSLRHHLAGKFPMKAGAVAILELEGGIPPYQFSGFDPRCLDVQALTEKRFQLSYQGTSKPGDPSIVLRVHGRGPELTRIEIPVLPGPASQHHGSSAFAIEVPALQLEQYRNLAAVLAKGRPPYQFRTSENLLFMRSGHDDALLYGLHPGPALFHVTDADGRKAHVRLEIVPNRSGTREAPSHNLSVALSAETLQVRSRIFLEILDGRAPFQVRQEGGDGMVDVLDEGKGRFRIEGRAAGTVRLGIRDGQSLWAFRALTVATTVPRLRSTLRMKVDGDTGWPGTEARYAARVEHWFKIEVEGGSPPFTLHDAFGRASVRSTGERSFSLRSMLRGKLIRPVVVDARGERLAETVYIR